MAIKPTAQTSRLEPEAKSLVHSDAHRVQNYECDQCGGSFEGQPAGSGLFIWTRGDEIRFEEPPLCDECALAVSTCAVLMWQLADEEEN
jgi:hypothetical protein